MWLIIYLFIYKYVFIFSAEKYCKLVSDEGGIRLLQGLSENSRTTPTVRELVDMTLEQCRQQVENV